MDNSFAYTAPSWMAVRFASDHTWFLVDPLVNVITFAPQVYDLPRPNQIGIICLSLVRLMNPDINGVALFEQAEQVYGYVLGYRPVEWLPHVRVPTVVLKDDVVLAKRVEGGYETHVLVVIED